MNIPSIIYLIGPMGAGKTSVAKELAKFLSFEFIDTDFAITQSYGKSITEIFSTYGEDEFRLQEEAFLQQYVQHSNIVVATGGGCVLNCNNRSLLQQHGFICYLKVSFTQQLERLSTDCSRPLMPTQKMHDEREPLYAAIADIAIDTDNQKVDMVVDAILTKIRCYALENH